MFKAILGKVHHHAIFTGRVAGIVEAMGPMIPQASKILDVGAGDGRIAAGLANRSSAKSVEGLDVMHRPTADIPITLFNGTEIPFADNSFDVVTFVDVLHHTDNPGVLINEAARVAREAVVIKDHFSENAVDNLTLRLMDWVGNAPHGVVLPYNYASRDAWRRWFGEAQLTQDETSDRVDLYPVPLSWIFGRGLHFVSRLLPPGSSLKSD
ncbi:MAG: class I SAM-dependent methyltransferase [Pseudomonadota bacterium]